MRGRGNASQSKARHLTEITQHPVPHIRLATAADLATVEEIVASAYGHYVARIGREPGPMLDDYAALIGEQRVHVLEVDRSVEGLVVLIPEGSTMLLDNVAVRPRVKGQGYGRVLLDFAERSAIAAGCTSIRLYTHELMTENQALYARIGFVETHRAEEIGLRRVFMSKTLLPSPRVSV